MGTTKMPIPIARRRRTARNRIRTQAVPGPRRQDRGLAVAEDQGPADGQRSGRDRFGGAGTQNGRDWRWRPSGDSRIRFGKAALAHQDLFAIQRETHVRIRDAHIADLAPASTR
jgi:hypothetical protein